VDLVCQSGRKGRFKRSKKEFEIVSTTTSTSTIRFHWEKELYELPDTELREAAEEIATWTV
jgi:hypothetical protein